MSELKNQTGLKTKLLTILSYLATIATIKKCLLHRTLKLPSLLFCIKAPKAILLWLLFWIQIMKAIVITKN